MALPSKFHSFCILLIAVFFLNSCTSSEASSIEQPLEVQAASDPNHDLSNPSIDTNANMIQVAILLDTSGSMQGLIDQAKNQLWEIVNKVTSARNPDGSEPIVRVALYQYGNDGLSVLDNYIEKITDFTGELDQVSAELFALRTNGGEEYCGAVIGHSLEHLEWVDNDESLKVVFIAGNEPFSQGPIAFSESCQAAKENGIVVNTIFCGDYQSGLSSGWDSGAKLADGTFFNINSDATTVHIDSPFDDRILELNEEFNSTYLYYGELGSEKKRLQISQDEMAAELGTANYSKRAISKNSNAYVNVSWDLVDAFENDSNLVMNELTLPKELENKSEEELKEIVLENKLKRDKIKLEMAELKIKREAFVAEVKAQEGNDESQLDDAVLSAIENQAIEAGFQFD